MSTEPLVSIVVPVYGVEAWLDACVTSVLAQTHRRLEVLLVDDGSPDRCGQMCDAWARRDTRVRALHKPNGGLSDARNHGLSRATGEWVLFVDSDDELEPGCVEACLAVARETGAECVRFRYQAVDEEGLPVTSTYEDESSAPVGTLPPDDACRALFDGRVGNFSVLLFACRDLYVRDGILFPLNQKFEDISTTYRVFLAANKVVFISDKFYLYRQREGSILHQLTVETFRDKMLALDGRLQDIRANHPELLPSCLRSAYREYPGFYVNFLYYPGSPSVKSQGKRLIRQNGSLSSLVRIDGLSGINRLILVLIKLRILDLFAPRVRLLRGNEAISSRIAGKAR